jgi:hypothetical protein
VVVLKKFWETRQGLLLAPPLLPEGESGMGEDGEEDGEALPSGSAGLHATLRAMAQQPDLRRDLARLPAPLLLLASAQDRWVLPTHADAIVHALTHPGGGLQGGRGESSNSSVENSNRSVGSGGSSVGSGSSSMGSGGSSRSSSSTEKGLQPWSEAGTPQELVVLAAQRVILNTRRILALHPYILRQVIRKLLSNRLVYLPKFPRVSALKSNLDISRTRFIRATPRRCSHNSRRRSLLRPLLLR